MTTNNNAETDDVWVNVKALLIAAKDLEERGRVLTLQEALMVRDVREMLSAIDLDDFRARLETNLGVRHEAMG